MSIEQIKDKARFFALYYRQEVLVLGIPGAKLVKCYPDLAEHNTEMYLELRSLDNISQADLELCTSLEEGSVNTSQGYLQVSDYLRSQGYLLPFKGYSIEKILEMGWAKYPQK